MEVIMACGFSGSNGGITDKSYSLKEIIMAVGFSGSNGGITGNGSQINGNELMLLKAAPKQFITRANFPMEVSYFINNICNLQCKHCYVGLKNAKGSLSVTEWQSVFADCISMGALTFGNVGKEPTLSWSSTLALLQWFKEQKVSVPRLRYGIVTNATKLDKRMVSSLADVDPTYVDVSLDGTEILHDYIRGNGAYRATFANLTNFPEELKRRVFISFTANSMNLGSFAEMVDELYQIGIRNFLISPYVSTQVGMNENWRSLIIDDSTIASFAERMLAGGHVDWAKYDDLQIYFKSDYATSRGVMNRLEEWRIIKPSELLIDEYGVIFNKYEIGSNIVYFNYIPFDDTFVRSVRISHDGFVSSCYAMFTDDETYRKLAIGNVRKKSMREILGK